MSRKRTRASVQVEETKNKFNCEEAKARYDSIFINQQMLTEKGFTLKESNYIDLMFRVLSALVKAWNSHLSSRIFDTISE
ncbi:hypothetical protein J1N35_011287, partial [Gossypium stocksii]